MRISLQSNMDVIINTPPEQGCINTVLTCVATAGLCTLSTSWGKKKVEKLWRPQTDPNVIAQPCPVQKIMRDGCPSRRRHMTSEGVSVAPSLHQYMRLMGRCVWRNSALVVFLIVGKCPKLLQSGGGKFFKPSSECFSVVWKDAFPHCHCCYYVVLYFEATSWWVFQGKQQLCVPYGFQTEA